MNRHDSERGGVAVLTALLLPLVLIPVAALLVDAGALQAERRQLQNGADAAALAVAQQCADGHCGDATALAKHLADANADDGTTAVEDVALDTGAGRVRVATLSEEPDGRQAVSLRFARVWGLEDAEVRADATAGWGGPSAGTSALPLAISWCAFFSQTGGGIPSTTTEVTIRHLDNSTSGCTSPSGSAIPGGWGWLDTDDGTCAATSSITGQTDGKPGASVPDDCTGDDFTALQNTTVLLPLYEEAGGSGSSGWFKVHAYAAFQVTGYRFACPSRYRWNDGSSACGSSSDRFVKGYFTEFVTLDDAFELGGTDYGGRVVRFTD